MKPSTLLISIFFISNVIAQGPVWTNYTSSKNPFTIEVAGEYLWIGSDGGVTVYHPPTGNKTYLNRSNSLLPNNEVRAIAVENSGVAWLGTRNHGILKIDNGNSTVYTPANMNVSFIILTELAHDNAGNLWVGTNDGLIKFDGSTWTNYTSVGSGFNLGSITSITIDQSGNKWIGTLNGLVLFDDTNWTIFNESNSLLAGNLVTDIEIDSQGTMWVSSYGTNGGLTRIDGSTWTVFDESNSGLSDNAVSMIEIDGTTVWGSTEYATGGIFKFDGVNWESMASEPSNFPALSMAIDNSGEKWVGYFGEGLFNVDNTSSPNWINHPISNSHLKTNVILALDVDPTTNTLWVCDYEQATISLNNGTWSVFPGGRYWLTIQNTDHIWTGGVFEVVEIDNLNVTNHYPLNSETACSAIDMNGDLWVGNGGIAKYDGNNWTTMTTSNSNIPSDVWSAMAFDSNNTMWLGNSSGLYSFDGTNWTEYNTSNSGLGSNLVNDICIDSNGTIWIATSQGVSKFDGTNWTIYTSSNSGLPVDLTKVIEVDENDNIWIGTKGIAKFDGTTWEVFNTSNSRIPNDDTRAIAFGENDLVWIGTDLGGIGLYNPHGDDQTLSQEPISDAPVEITVFPNPFEDFFTIEIPDKLLNSELLIYDNTGRIVKKVILTEALSNVSTFDMSSGIYLYTVAMKSQLFKTGKIIHL